MDDVNLKARMLRALSGLTQAAVADKLGVSPSLIDQIERGLFSPGPEHMEGLAAEADFTRTDADELFEHWQTLRRSRRWPGPGVAAILAELHHRLQEHTSRAYQQVLTLPRPENPPRPEEKIRGAELLERLKPRSQEARLAAVQDCEEYQSWFVCEACCEESIREASRDLVSAAAWAQLAVEAANLVRGVPEAFGKSLLGYAIGHRANILKAAGEPKLADIVLDEAKKMWLAGSDPDGVLLPGRLFEIEASLRREQRRFEESLTLYDRAGALSHRRHALVGKAFTWECMGEYENAIVTLLQAMPLVDQQAEPRLWAILRLNLAKNYCHVSRYSEAEQFIAAVLPSVAVDVLDAVRARWLQGRIAAGLGQPKEALKYLAEARKEFASRNLTYDVAQALLEELGLLLEQGRKEEVKALAPELAQVFESKGVHREALAALRLFQEAVEREEATAELARSVLRFLFRARYDQELSFKAS